MTTLSRRLHVTYIDSELKRVIHHLRTPSADYTLIRDAGITVKQTNVSILSELWEQIFHIPCKEAVII